MIATVPAAVAMEANPLLAGAHAFIPGALSIRGIIRVKSFVPPGTCDLVHCHSKQVENSVTAIAEPSICIANPYPIGDRFTYCVVTLLPKVQIRQSLDEARLDLARQFWNGLAIRQHDPAPCAFVQSSLVEET